jgi:tetratricopeptide (TPR) repeat protein
MLDLATTLDPLFNVAYRFGAIFLAEPYPGGAGRPDLAIELLEKGLRARPDKWEYMQDAGFVNYWWRQDYKAAAGWFERASRVTGAPWWLQSLAATTLAEGGDRQSSRLMWQSIRDSGETDWLKNDAERRLTQLDALDQIDQLQKILDQASAAAGVTLTDWMPLVRGGVLPGLPVDPSGTPFEIDANGRTKVSQKSPLMPMPREPQTLGSS